MSCRCSEIIRCEQDVELIAGEVTHKLGYVQNKNDYAMKKCPDLGCSMLNAVFTDTLERLTQRFSTIKKQQDGNIDNLQTKRANELKRTQSRLDSYIREDERYHDMMAKRAR